MAFIRAGNLVLNTNHIISAERLGETTLITTTELVPGAHEGDGSRSATHRLHGPVGDAFWHNLSHQVLDLPLREEYTVPTPAARPALTVVSS